MATLMERLDALVAQEKALRVDDAYWQTFIVTEDDEGFQDERYSFRRGTGYCIKHPTDCEDHISEEDGGMPRLGCVGSP